MSDTSLPTATPLDAAEVMKLHAELEAIQAKAAANLATADEARRGIDIIRLLRRTNTGPSAGRSRKKATTVDFDPLALLKQTVA